MGMASLSDLVFELPVVSLPIVGSGLRFPVRRIYCVGRNYLDHIREFGNDEREPPFFFAKHRDCIVQNGAEIAYPSLTSNYQHELELVVALKSGGTNIRKEDALSHVFGYAVGLDMTRRDLQLASRKKEQPWEAGKSFDESAPCGAVTPAENFPDPFHGKIQLYVNGKLQQTGDLAQMIWTVPEVIAELSKQVGVEAGDLIFTGTPSGVVACGRADKLVGTVNGLEPLAVSIV
jgi:fumarylpyruvate hydrolase